MSWFSKKREDEDEEFDAFASNVKQIFREEGLLLDGCDSLITEEQTTRIEEKIAALEEEQPRRKLFGLF